MQMLQLRPQHYLDLARREGQRRFRHVPEQVMTSQHTAITLFLLLKEVKLGSRNDRKWAQPMSIRVPWHSWTHPLLEPDLVMGRSTIMRQL